MGTPDQRNIYHSQRPIRRTDGPREPEIPGYYCDTYEGLYRWFSRFFDMFVKTFFFIFNGGFGGERRWRGHIVDWLDPRSGEKVVDLCCGTGTLAILIAERMAGSGEVVGIEVSPAQIDMARRKRKPDIVSFLQGDASRTGYPAGYFDKGVISGALHELPAPVRGAVLRELFRITRSRARIVIVEHNRPSSRWKARLFDFLERFNPEYPTYRDLLDSGLTREIEQAGFKIVKTDTTTWEWFQTVLAERPMKCDTRRAQRSSKQYRRVGRTPGRRAGRTRSQHGRPRQLKNPKGDTQDDR